MSPVIDTRDWCDVDSDEDFCIPELPPLPELVKFEWVKEDPPLFTLTKQTPKVVSPAKPFRFRKDIKDRSPKPKSAKSSDYVCFVGKFPNQTTIADLRSFVKSKGISFTDIRLGPKKKPNVNAFGYVDLPTRQDYDMLLSLDGALYRGRTIRVDHATRKVTSSRSARLKRELPRNGEFAQISTPPLKQRKSYRRQEVQGKEDVYSKKTRARAQRLKTVRSQNTGIRRKQKYGKVKKNSAPKKNIRYRLEPIREKANAKVAVVIQQEALGRKKKTLPR